MLPPCPLRARKGCACSPRKRLAPCAGRALDRSRPEAGVRLFPNLLLTEALQGAGHSARALAHAAQNRPSGCLCRGSTRTARHPHHSLRRTSTSPGPRLAKSAILRTRTAVHALSCGVGGKPSLRENKTVPGDQLPGAACSVMLTTGRRIGPSCGSPGAACVQRIECLALAAVHSSHGRTRPCHLQKRQSRRQRCVA